MDSLDAASVVLIVLWAVDIRATYLQWTIWRLDRRNVALRSRLLAGILLTVAASAVAMLAASRLLHLRMPEGDLFGTAVLVFILISLPQAHWLWQWWRDWT